MIRSIAMSFSLLFVILVAGCGVFDRGYAVKPLDSKDAFASYARIKEALIESSDRSPGLVPTRCFAAPITVPDQDVCKQARNQAVAVMAFASSELCQLHRTSIYGREAVANISLGSLTSLAAGGAAIASSKGAKTLYGALALFFNSERSLVNEVVYKTMIVTAVDQKIAETMETQETLMKPNLSKNVLEYTVQEAVADMVRIHNSCSFMNGLRLALAEGTQSNTRRILTLRQIVSAADSAMKTACIGTTPPPAAGAPPPPETGIDVACAQSKDRYKAVSATLKTVESAAN